MAHLSELSAALQSALDRNVIFNFPYAKVVLDPDGDAIDLTDYVLSDKIEINKSRNINPDESFGKLSVSELTVKFINKNNYFSPENIDGPFYHATTRLYADYSAGSSTIDIPKDFTVKTGLIIQISHGLHTAEATVSSIDESDSYFNRLTLNTTFSYDYPAGSMVETKYRVGQKIQIQTAFNDLTDTIEQYSGIIAALPKIYGPYAEITLQDNLKGLLNTQLKANTTRRIVTTLSSYMQGGLEITRADSTSPSSGNISESSIQINESYCAIGSWEIEFTSSTDFKVTDPNNVEYTGSTSGDFYAGDSSIYQLKIPSSAWSGSWDAGDKINFNTYCTICKANYGTNGNTAPKIIERLLTESFGGNLSVSEYDSSSLNQLISDFMEFRAGISFGQSISVLKAIEIMMRHIYATIYFLNDGKIAFKSYKPQPEPSSVNTLSPEADIIDVSLEEKEKYLRIVGYWDWDYSNNQFNKRYSYPTEEGEPHIEVKLPAYTADEDIYAQSIIRKMFNLWERGLKLYRIKEKWNYAIGWDLGDQIQVSGTFPEIDSKTVEIHSIRKSVNRPQEIEAIAYDISFRFGRYLFINEGLINDGRVVW